MAVSGKDQILDISLVNVDHRLLFGDASIDLVEEKCLCILLIEGDVVGWDCYIDSILFTDTDVVFTDCGGPLAIVPHDGATSNHVTVGGDVPDILSDE